MNNKKDNERKRLDKFIIMATLSALEAKFVIKKEQGRIVPDICFEVLEDFAQECDL